MKGGDKMDTLAARSFRVLLAVTLAANCCLPCYTLAYADQPTYGGANYEQLRENQPKRSGDGQADQGADFQGLLWREAAEKTSPGSEFLSLAGAGRVRPSADVLFEASYSMADSLIRLASARAYAVEPQGVEDVSQEEQEEIAGDAGGFEFSLGVGESGVDAADGGAAAEGHGADYGAPEGAGEDTSADYGGLVFASDLPLYSVRAASASDVVGQTWGSVKDTVSATWGLVKDYLTWFYDGGTSWQTNISTADKVKIIPQFTTMNLLKQQWGYNYGTGNTIVWAKNSPAGWLYSINDLSERIRVNTNLTQEYLSSVRNYLKATAGDGVEYSAASYLRNTRQDVGSIKSYLVANGGDGVPYPAASWLKSAVDELRSIDTYSGYIRTNTNLAQEKLSTVSSLTERAGNFLKAKADDGVEYSAASYLHTLAKNSNILLGYSKSKGSDGVEYSFTGFLNMIAERTRSLPSLNSNSADYYNQVLSKLGLLNDSVHTLDMIEGLLATWGGRWDSEYRIVIEWGKAWETYRDDLFAKLDGLNISNGSWSESDKSFLFDKLDALDKSPADLSETNKLLGRLTGDVASIRDKYVVGDSLSDMFSALVGDLQVPATAAAIDGIKGAMSTAFPFCIPSVVNLVLFGSVVADPQAPVWEFDIAGSPLVVDFAPYEDFAEVCRWTVRLLFVAALLLNTRKFVYGMGGAY